MVPFFPGLDLLLFSVCTWSSTRCCPVRSPLSDGSASEVSSPLPTVVADRSGSGVIILSYPADNPADEWSTAGLKTDLNRPGLYLWVEVRPRQRRSDSCRQKTRPVRSRPSRWKTLDLQGGRRVCVWRRANTHTHTSVCAQTHINTTRNARTFISTLDLQPHQQIWGEKRQMLKSSHLIKNYIYNINIYNNINNSNTNHAGCLNHFVRLQFNVWLYRQLNIN